MPSPPRSSVRLPSDRDASGRDLGDAELELLREVVQSGHLNSTGGTFVPRFEREFAARMGQAHAIACASGSAAIHAAIASLQLAAGDEVVTTGITDMGAILPICYEGLVPVFADVDPESGNVTAATIEKCLGERTRAIIVTHLFGLPCVMAPIVALARARGIALIEDCAQAFLAECDGAMIGSFGDLACYSFQQGKHMTTGEGGMVTTNSAALASRVTRFVNKGWGYGDASPDHDRPGLNYRLTELQAAVGIAQLAKLDGVVARRIARADELHALLGDLPGVGLPNATVAHGVRHTYWRYALRIDGEILRGGPVAFGAALGAAGVPNAPRYIQKPAFECAVFAGDRDLPTIRLAARQRRGVSIQRAEFPGTTRALEQLLVLPWNEHYTAEHVELVADEIRAAWQRCHTPS